MPVSLDTPVFARPFSKDGPNEFPAQVGMDLQSFFILFGTAEPTPFAAWKLLGKDDEEEPEILDEGWYLRLPPLDRVTAIVRYRKLLVLKAVEVLNEP